MGESAGPAGRPRTITGNHQAVPGTALPPSQTLIPTHPPHPSPYPFVLTWPCMPGGQLLYFLTLTPTVQLSITHTDIRGYRLISYYNDDRRGHVTKYMLQWRTGGGAGWGLGFKPSRTQTSQLRCHKD